MIKFAKCAKLPIEFIKKILYWEKNLEDNWEIKQNQIHPYETHAKDWLPNTYASHDSSFFFLYLFLISVLKCAELGTWLSYVCMWCTRET